MTQEPNPPGSHRLTTSAFGFSIQDIQLDFLLEWQLSTGLSAAKAEFPF